MGRKGSSEKVLVRLVGSPKAAIPTTELPPWGRNACLRSPPPLPHPMLGHWLGAALEKHDFGEEAVVDSSQSFARADEHLSLKDLS